MFTQTMLTLALVVGAPTLKDKEQPATKIPVGEWEVTEMTQNGQDLLPLLGNKLTIKIEEKTLTMNMPGMAQTVNVEWDTSKTPATIRELKMNLLGIFKVEKGILTMCLNNRAESALPDNFSAGKGSERSLMVLKKIEKKEDKKD